MIYPAAQEVSYSRVGRFKNGVDVMEVFFFFDNSHTPGGQSDV
jgi:hypothetical protein